MKFSDADGAPIDRANTYDLNLGRGWSCVHVSTSSSVIDLILDLIADWSPPFFILYVHVVPRTDHQAGRYQSPPIEGQAEIEQFFKRFRALLEGDGRHHLWVASPDQGRQIIYDRHEILYVYGDDDRAIATLTSRGFERGQVGIPAPHAHNYDAEFDASVGDLMRYWDWSHAPLQKGDE